MPLRLIQAFPVRGHDLPDGFYHALLRFLVRQRHIQPVLVNVIVNGKQPRLLCIYPHFVQRFTHGQFLQGIHRRRAVPRAIAFLCVIEILCVQHCPVHAGTNGENLLPAVGQTRVCFAVKQMLLPIAHRKRLAIGDFRSSPFFLLFDAAPLFDLRCAESSRH